MIRWKLHSLTVLSSNTLYISAGPSNLWQTWIIGLYCVIGSYVLLVIMANFDLVLRIKGAAHTCIHEKGKPIDFLSNVLLYVYNCRSDSTVSYTHSLYLVKSVGFKATSYVLRSTIHWIEILYQQPQIIGTTNKMHDFICLRFC